MEIHIFRCHRGDRSIRSPWKGTSLVMAFPDNRELSLDMETASAGLDSVWEFRRETSAGGSGEPRGPPYFVCNCVCFMDI